MEDKSTKMCGRYTIRELRLLEAALGVLVRRDDENPPIKVPTFNAAPGQFHPIAYLEKRNAVLTAMKWGFVPSWTKDKPKFAPINAVGETVATSKMFGRAFSQRRCLIPADGFYEPKGAKTEKHRPWFYFHMADDSPFCFGGIWERWNSPDGPADTYAILTTTPNKLLAQIHDRQPVIIDAKDYKRWLDPQTPAGEVAEMLNAIADDRLEAWPVSDAAKSPKGEGEKLIEPIGAKI